ncbi:MAG: hypothetical protein MI924_35935, partial [Chloroflexales bacterium]|nr:hypothetical protein [Chloroflexales bacterium]
MVRITTHAFSQQAHLLLTWTQNGRHDHILPLTVLLDGGPHTLVAPVGAHPGWQGGVRNLRLVAPHWWEAPPFHVARIQVLHHPLLPLDRWLLRTVYRAVSTVQPVLPRYAQVQLVIITLLVAGLALAAPWSHWRRRLALVGLALAGALSLGTILAFVNVLSAVGSTYGGVSDQTAARQAPSYMARSSAIAQLVAVADQLPAGPVLLLDINPNSDLLHRARYRFYPRRVDVRSPQQAPAAIPQLLTTHYTAAIQATPTDQ